MNIIGGGVKTRDIKKLTSAGPGFGLIVLASVSRLSVIITAAELGDIKLL